jgi:predicted RNA-binding Zn-ribbon protein involved in translation (DUF1610 family)
MLITTMINRTFILKLMFAALAVTALLGVAAVLTQGEDVLKMSGTALAVATACGLTCCWTLLGTLRPFRHVAPALAIATAIELLLITLLIWSDELHIQDEWKLALCMWVIFMMQPATVAAMMLHEYASYKSAGRAGFISTQCATAAFCISIWSNSTFDQIFGVFGGAIGICGWLIALLLLPAHTRHKTHLNVQTVLGIASASLFGLLWVALNTRWQLNPSEEPHVLLMNSATAAGALATGLGLSSLINALVLPGNAAWLRRTTIICTWCTLLMTSYLVFNEHHGYTINEDELAFRITIALGIFTLCGIAAVMSLAIISTALRKMRPGTGHVQLNCPVCHMKQTISPGEHSCPTCMTVIRFDFEVTRCQQCRYQRTGWTSDTCPECGWIIGTLPKHPA